MSALWRPLVRPSRGNPGLGASGRQHRGRAPGCEQLDTGHEAPGRVQRANDAPLSVARSLDRFFDSSANDGTLQNVHDPRIRLQSVARPSSRHCADAGRLRGQRDAPRRRWGRVLACEQCITENRNSFLNRDAA